MNKLLLFCTAIILQLFVPFHVLSTQSAALSIDAEMAEAPCDISFTQPNIHVRDISRSTLGTSPAIVPGDYTSMLLITSLAPMNALITVTDGSPGPIDPAVSSTGANFAFGYKSGYYITISQPMGGPRLNNTSLVPAQLLDNAVAGASGSETINHLQPKGFRWLMSDGTAPSARLFQARFRIYPVMPAASVLPAGSLHFYGAIIATVNFAI